MIETIAVQMNALLMLIQMVVIDLMTTWIMKVSQIIQALEVEMDLFDLINLKRKQFDIYNQKRYIFMYLQEMEMLALSADLY